MLPTVYALNDGECIPYFIPDITVRAGRFQLLGVVGVIVRDFEEYWSNILTEEFRGRFSDDRLTLVCYLTNMLQLIDPPGIADLPMADDFDSNIYLWLERIKNYIEFLPRTYREFDSAVSRNDLNGVEFNKFYGHPVKLYALRQWSSSKNLLPSLQTLKFPDPMRRVQPYENALFLRDLMKPG